MGNNPVSYVDPDGGRTSGPPGGGGPSADPHMGRPNPSQQTPPNTNWGSFFSMMNQMNSFQCCGGYAPKPASSYDYSKEGMETQKFNDDIDYIVNGKIGDPISRIGQLVNRDWKASSTEAKVELAMAPVAFLRIGKIVVDAKKFHRLIKPSILKNAGNFEKTVGKNPDILVEGGKIVLQGTGPFKGKRFTTILDPSDFF